MVEKDFENYELRLQKLREESLEYFERAETYFSEEYETHLREIFPRDILWVKREIWGYFVTMYGESLRDGDRESARDIFQRSVEYSIDQIPLSPERRQRLKKNILLREDFDETQEKFFSRMDDMSHDPFYALIEDFSLDGEISREEFLLLQESFSGRGNFLLALEALPEDIKKMFLTHIELALEWNFSEKQKWFQEEFSSELAALENKGLGIHPTVRFISRYYYKTPGKYRKYESPKRRLRRTMKLALLKLLRIKLGNVEAENILKKFEQGENFDDYFILLHKLMEIIDENPAGEEIYAMLALEDETQSDVLSAEENKEKIMRGDFLVTKIANLFSKTDAGQEGSQENEAILERLLDENTDLVWEEVYFNRDDMAGIFAESTPDIQDDEEEDELTYSSPESAYEILKRDFHTLEEEKTQLFSQGKYDEIDRVNDQLLKISVRLEKLSKILHVEV